MRRGISSVRGPEPCRLKLRRQLPSGAHIPPIPPEHPLEHSVELAHGRARRLDGDRAEIELLCHHHASWLSPGRHFFEDGDRIAHLHEQEPAVGEVERRACRLLEFEKIGCDLLELGSAFAAEILQASAPSAPSISMPVTVPSGPTRSAISRITAPGPAPTSRQLMPAPSPTAASTCAVAPYHMRACSRRRWYSLASAFVCLCRGWLCGLLPWSPREYR